MLVSAILDSKGHSIISVAPGDSVASVVKLLAERKIGAVLVMTKHSIDGIISERDIVRVIAQRGAGALDEEVSAVMTHKVVTCKPSDTVGEIMEHMTRGKFRHLPVLAEGKVVGLISIGDVVKTRVREFEHEQEALKEYIATA